MQENVNNLDLPDFENPDKKYSFDREYEIKKLQTLLNISSDLYESVNFEEVGYAIYKNLLKFKVGESFQTKLGVYDIENDEYKIVFQTGTETDTFKKYGFQTNKAYSKHEIGFFSQIAIETRKTLVIQDNHSEESYKIDVRQKDFPEQSMIFIPMFYKNDFVGLFSLARTPKNTFDQDFINFLESVTNYACIKIVGLLSEQRLKRSDNLFHGIFNSVLIGVTIATPEKNWIAINDKFCEMTGYSEEELKKKTWWDLIPKEDYEIEKKVHDDSINGTLKDMYGQKRLVRKDGKLIYVELSIYCVRKNDGSIDYMVCLIQDITEKKLAEMKLQESERRWQFAIEGSEGGVWDWNIQNDEVFFSKRWKEMLGFEEHEIKNHFSEWERRVHPDDLTAVKKDIKKHFDGETSVYVNEHRMLCKDGSYKWIHDRGKIITYDDNGNPIRMVGTHIDITQTKQVQIEVQKAKAQMQAILDNMPFSAWLKDTDGIFLSVNKQFVNYCGLPLEKIIGYTDFEIWPQKLAEKYVKGDRDVVNAKERVYFEDSIDGKTWHEIFETPIFNQEGEVIGTTGLARDITEKKISEEVINRNINRLRLITDNMLDVVKYIDKNNKFSFVTPSIKWVFGYDIMEVIGKSYFNFIHEEDRKFITNKFHIAALNIETSNRIEYRYKCKDGRYIWVESQINFLFSESNEYEGAVIGSRDVSERKNIAESLLAEKERLSVTLRSIGDGVITTDISGKILLMNRVAEELTEYSTEQAFGKNIEEVFNILNRKDKSRSENPVLKILNSKNVTSLTEESILISRKGLERIIANSGAPIRDKESSIIGVVLVFRDITEKERLEEELLKKQKLESIGVLAGGIAHDFNNFLTSILGNIQIARLKGLSNELDKYLINAEKASIRAKGLTQQLLTFSKGGSPVIKSGCISELLTEVTSFTLRGSSVSIQYKLPDNLFKVKMDEGQISQVIQNIVINAKESMPLGGKISIFAENVEIDQNNFYNLKEGKYIKVSIQDEGMGIPKDFLPRIFDPYFTTKEQGHGLGLAVCYSIIANHNGYITVESEVSRGTKFTFLLPAAEELELSGEFKSKTIEGGAGRILIMDDDEMVGEIAKSILEELGFQVTLCTDGRVSIEIYKKALEKNEKFHIVILDLTVPGGMGGEKTVKKLLEIDPEVVAVVSSGYSNDPIMANFQKYGFKGAIVKPYEIKELDILINKLLTNIFKK